MNSRLSGRMAVVSFAQEQLKAMRSRTTVQKTVVFEFDKTFAKTRFAPKNLGLVPEEFAIWKRRALCA